MRPRVGLVADDLTGAADTAVAFLAAGASAVVAWPGRALAGAWPSLAAEVLAVDTRSRSADAEYARDITREVVSTLRRAGVGTLYKKIDSMLRGHVGDEVRAAIDAWHPGSLAVVAPAFPGAGRTTVDGRQCVHGAPLESRAFVPALFEEVGISTRSADLACVRGTALASFLLECQRQQPAGAVVCDAETDEDLRAIARAATGLGPAIIWVGTGGLARAMAANIVAAGPRVVPPTTRVSGPLLIVVGSRSEVARAQADDLAAGVRSVVVPVGTLASEAVMAGGEIASNGIARQIEAQLRAGEDVLVTLGPANHGARAASADDPRLMARLGEVLRPCAPAVGGLIVTGGDTAIGVLEAWGTTGLRLVEEIDPGVVRSETIGTLAMPVVTKAGAFGDRGTLTRARQRLRRTL